MPTAIDNASEINLSQIVSGLNLNDQAHKGQELRANGTQLYLNEGSADITSSANNPSRAQHRSEAVSLVHHALAEEFHLSPDVATRIFSNVLGQPGQMPGMVTGGDVMALHDVGTRAALLMNNNNIRTELAFESVIREHSSMSSGPDRASSLDSNKSVTPTSIRSKEPVGAAGGTSAATTLGGGNEITTHTLSQLVQGGVTEAMQCMTGLSQAQIDNVLRHGTVELAVADRLSQRIEDVGVHAVAINAEAQGLLGELPEQEQAGARQLAETLCSVVYGTTMLGRPKMIPENLPPEVKEMAKILFEDIDTVNASRQAQNQPPMNDRERETMAASVFCNGLGRLASGVNTLLRNEGESRASRYAGNLLNTTARAGVTVFLATIIRNAAMYAMQQAINAGKVASQANLAETTIGGRMTTEALSYMTPQAASIIMNAVGGIVLGTTALMHLAAVGRDLATHTGTPQTYLSHGVHAALATASGVTAVARGNWPDLTTWYAGIALYCLARGIVAATVKYNTNVTNYGRMALVPATIMYAGAQSSVNALQHSQPEALKGANTAPRIGTGSHTAHEIAGAPQPMAANAGYSTLNAAVEIFDDLQSNTFFRMFNTYAKEKELAEVGPQVQAQIRAAAMRGILECIRSNPGVGREGLQAAAEQGMLQFRHTETEGVRIGLARAPVSQVMVEARVQRTYDGLNALGFRLDGNIAPNAEGPAGDRNRMILALMGDELRRLHLEQPLEMSQLASRDGLERAAGRFTSQFLDIESYRLTFFQTLINVVYAASGPDGVDRPQGADETAFQHAARVNAGESLSMALGVAAPYPFFYLGATGRADTPEAQEAARVQQIGLRNIMLGNMRADSGAVSIEMQDLGSDEVQPLNRKDDDLV